VVLKPPLKVMVVVLGLALVQAVTMVVEQVVPSPPRLKPQRQRQVHEMQQQQQHYEGSRQPQPLPRCTLMGYWATARDSCFCDSCFCDSCFSCTLFKMHNYVFYSLLQLYLGYRTLVCEGDAHLTRDGSYACAPALLGSVRGR
jgi:hypothetical protein